VALRTGRGSSPKRSGCDGGFPKSDDVEGPPVTGSDKRLDGVGQ
jgi:hypothetical protein